MLNADADSEVEYDSILMALYMTIDLANKDSFVKARLFSAFWILFRVEVVSETPFLEEALGYTVRGSTHFSFQNSMLFPYSNSDNFQQSFDLQQSPKCTVYSLKHIL